MSVKPAPPPSRAHQLIYLTRLMLHRMTHVVVSLVIILVLVRILSDAVPVVIPETFFPHRSG
jgi:hypothetical protein